MQAAGFFWDIAMRLKRMQRQEQPPLAMHLPRIFHKENNRDKKYQHKEKDRPTFTNLYYHTSAVGLPHIYTSNNSNTR